jgi:hypothetical protein
MSKVDKQTQTEHEEIKANSLIEPLTQKDAEYFHARLRQEYPKQQNVFFTRKFMKNVKWCE